MLGAAIAALDALVNDKPVGRAAVRGLVAGAIGGAIGNVAGVAASSAIESAAKGVIAVVGLGASTYSAVQSFKEGNYFSGTFSALAAFMSASELYSSSSSASAETKSKAKNSQETPSKQSGGALDSSSESSFSGSGNEDAELFTRDHMRKTGSETVDPQVSKTPATGLRGRDEIAIPLDPTLGRIKGGGLQVKIAFKIQNLPKALYSGLVGTLPRVFRVTGKFMGISKRVKPFGKFTFSKKEFIIEGLGGQINTPTIIRNGSEIELKEALIGG